MKNSRKIIIIVFSMAMMAFSLSVFSFSNHVVKAKSDVRIEQKQENKCEKINKEKVENKDEDTNGEIEKTKEEPQDNKEDNLKKN